METGNFRFTNKSDAELFDLAAYGKSEVVRKYTGKLYLMRQYLAKLAQFAEVGHGELGTLDWGHVGDLTEVNTKLQQMCELLELEG